MTIHQEVQKLLGGQTPEAMNLSFPIKQGTHLTGYIRSSFSEVLKPNNIAGARAALVSISETVPLCFRY
jgi:hypothetical protein